jgi:hypothetical protein
MSVPSEVAAAPRPLLCSLLLAVALLALGVAEAQQSTPVIAGLVFVDGPAALSVQVRSGTASSARTDWMAEA